MLEEHVSQNLNDHIRHIAVVVSAAHVTAFSRQMVAIADFVFLGPSVVFIERFRRRVRIVWVDTVPILVDWNKFFRLDAWQRKLGSEEIFGATDNRRGRPQQFR